MKILVTGGAGFIGSYVVDELRRRGHDPVIFDRRRIIDEIVDVEHFHGDVLDRVAVTEAAAHVEGIIHLAAVLGTQETIKNPQPSAHVNIIGSLNVFDAAAQYDLPVVYAGVGNHWMRTHGGGSYTISKTCVEDYAKMYNAHNGGVISVVRPMNAYGPRQSIAAPYGPSKVRKIIPAFICRALLGEPIEIYGDGTQVSDCVYVEDVARCFVKVLERSLQTRRSLRTIDVGPRVSRTVNDIAEMVKKITDSNSPIRHLSMRPGEVPNAVVCADTDTLSFIGEDPSQFVDLSEGLARTVEYFELTWLNDFKAARST